MNFFFNFYYYSMLLHEALDAKNILANFINVTAMYGKPPCKESLNLRFLLEVELKSTS